MPELEELEPTEEQQRIIEAMRGDYDTLVPALAGTGKTTTLAMGAFASRPRRGLYLVFNAEAGRQARGVFPGATYPVTLHAYAKRWLEDAGDERINRLNGDKLAIWDVADRLRIRTEEYITDRRFTKNKLAVLTKRMLQRFCWSEDSEPTLDHVPFVRGLEYNPRLGRHEDYHGELAQILLPFVKRYWEDVQSVEGKLPFEHDHYLKIWALDGHQLPHDYVLLDEAQDLNGVNIGAVWAQKSCQLVVVGDANQQIYEWRGAKNAMHTFANLERVCPLTRSYRFGPQLANIANLLLQALGSEYFVEGDPGKTTILGPIEGVPDAVLTRTNAGGLEEMLALRKAHGPDLRIGISDHMRKLAGFFEAVGKLEAGKPTTHPDLVGFNSWADVLDYVQETDDQDFKVRVKLVMLYGLEALVEMLDSAVEARPHVVVSTGHTAKGLEWDRVKLGADFELDPTQPLSHAELRLRYVACTRAKKHLDPSALWGGDDTWDTGITEAIVGDSDPGT